MSNTSFQIHQLFPPPIPTTIPQPPPRFPLLNLPLELHLHIIPYLSYPDALALKHTHPRFYNLIDTSVRLKVSWLLERKARNLPLPENNCVMRTDESFCAGEMRAIMERRRRHGECGLSKGACEIVVGTTCGGPRAEERRSWVGRLSRSLKGSSHEVRLWVALWVAALLFTGLLRNMYVATGLFTNKQVDLSTCPK